MSCSNHGSVESEHMILNWQCKREWFQRISFRKHGIIIWNSYNKYLMGYLRNNKAFYPHTIFPDQQIENFRVKFSSCLQSNNMQMSYLWHLSSFWKLGVKKIAYCLHANQNVNNWFKMVYVTLNPGIKERIMTESIAKCLMLKISNSRK